MIERSNKPASRRLVWALVGSAGLVAALVAALGPVGAGVQSALVVVAASAVLISALALAWPGVSAKLARGGPRTHERYSSLVRNSDDAIVILDASQRIVYASPAISTEWQWPADELLGADFGSLLSEPSVESAGRWLGRVVAGEVVGSLHAEWCDAGGRVRDVLMVASDLRRDREIRGIIVTARDVSANKALQEQLHHDASHDALTGLVNRPAFATAMEAGVAGGVIAFVGIDDFAEISKSFGHEAAETVRAEVAVRLSGSVRPQDLVARLGANEFGILLEAATDADVEVVSRRILGVGDSEVAVDDSQLRISVSVGFAFLAPESTPADCIRNAELAMFWARQAGTGRSAVSSPDMREQAEHRQDLRASVVSALVDEGLHLEYQNVVRPDDGVVVGREALLRWERADGSRISPADFIPIAEETGAIVEIGEFVLRTACRDAMDWPQGADGTTQSVSVNVSAVQLQHDFSSVVLRALNESGLPADRLQLELAESLMAVSDTAAAFYELGGLGVRLAIDDFGTGACSLAHLRQFKVDVIKIDRELVHGSNRNPQLLAGVTGLIRAIGATAVAEGVEDRADGDLLIELGIPLAQGHLWHLPCKHDELQTQAGHDANEPAGRQSDGQVQPLDVAVGPKPVSEGA